MKVTGIMPIDTEIEGVKTMGEMQPLEVCVIVGYLNDKYNGNIVMRTASKSTFEVIDLTDMTEDGYWSERHATIKVKPYKGKTLTLTLE